MHQRVEQKSGNVKVVCRFRPINERERFLGGNKIHEILDSNTIGIKDFKQEKTNSQPLQFNFDRVFDYTATQQEIFTYAASPVIDSVIQGFNGTIFAYGQTSSGKTHTMEGDISANITENSGIIPRMIKRVFDAISQSSQSIEFRLKISLVELYMEKLRDLLSPSKNDLRIRSDKKRGIYIENLTQSYISSADEVYKLMGTAQKNRAIAVTNMNERSSRSHMIFILTVSQNNTVDLCAKTGKLYLVDLAGSEKVGKSGAQGKVLEEAKKINASLTSLGKVISTLTDGKSTHIPYRDSKLTRILTESLGGNSKTTLIVTCSPHSNNLMETLSTLRFGVSAKKIKNKPKINREFTVPQLQNLLEKAEKDIKQRDKFIQQLKNYILNDLEQKSLPTFTNEKLESQKQDDDLLAEVQKQLQMQRSMHLLQEQQITNLKQKNEFLKTEIEALEKQNQKLKAILHEQTYHFSNQNTRSKLSKQEQQKKLLQKYEKQQKSLEDKMSKNDEKVEKKLIELENNLCDLTHAYYDLLIVQQRFKVDNIYLRKKQEQTDMYILSLKRELRDLEDQNRDLEEQKWCDEDKDFKFPIKDEQTAVLEGAFSKKSSNNSKVVKILRGGIK